MGLTRLRGSVDNTFATVQEMKDAVGLVVGDLITVTSYTATNNSGVLQFEIVAAATGTDDGGSYIDLSGSGLQAKQIFGDTISVKQFGAEGDGLQGIKSILDNIVSYLPATGGHIYFPFGHYLLEGPVDFGSKFIKLFGACSGFEDISSGGEKAPTLIEWSSTTAKFISNQPFHVSDIAFKGDNTFSSTCFDLKGANSEFMVIERNHFQDFNKVIFSNECWGGKFINNHCYQNVWTIYGTNATQLWLIEGNFFIRARHNPAWTAPDGEAGRGGFINLRDCAQNRIVNNDFESSSEETNGGIVAVSLLRCQETTISDNHFERNKWKNILLSSSDGNFIDRNFFWMGFDTTQPAGDEYIWNDSKSFGVYMEGTSGSTKTNKFRDNTFQILTGLYTGVRNQIGGHQGPIGVDPASVNNIFYELDGNTIEEASGSPGSDEKFKRLVNYQSSVENREVRNKPIRRVDDSLYYFQVGAGDIVKTSDITNSNHSEYVAIHTGTVRNGAKPIGTFSNTLPEITSITDPYNINAWRVNDIVRWYDGTAERESRVTANDGTKLTLSSTPPVAGVFKFYSALLKPNGAEKVLDTAGKVISSGAINVFRDDVFFVVDTEASAATDDLDTISNGYNGQVIMVSPFSSARTIVIKHGTGNIQCGSDITLDNSQDVVTLVYVSASSAWRVLSFNNNGA